jgi:hypothetical protein
MEIVRTPTISPKDLRVRACNWLPALNFHPARLGFNGSITAHLLHELLHTYPNEAVLTNSVDVWKARNNEPLRLIDTSHDLSSISDESLGRRNVADRF